MTGVVWLSYGVVVAFIVLVLIMLYVSIDTKNYQKRQQQIKRDVQEHTAACYRYFMNDEDKVVQTLPAKKGNTTRPFKQYAWANWEQPNSIYRLKPSYYMVQDAFMKNEQAFVK